eukprot:7292008-Pyramimonas_sp.AAC.1
MSDGNWYSANGSHLLRIKYLRDILRRLAVVCSTRAPSYCSEFQDKPRVYTAQSQMRFQAGVSLKVGE